MNAESEGKMKTKNELTQDFYALCEIEPRLKTLETEIIDFVTEAYKTGEKFTPDEKWYGFSKYRGKGIKPVMLNLVGFSAENPKLATSTAYDTAYSYLYILISDLNTRKLKKVS